MRAVPFPVRLGDERALPHNLEAERSLLGAILINPSALELATGIIDAADFFRDAHRRCFLAFQRLQARWVAVDLVTLKDELARSGELEDVGGPVYIGALVDGVPRSLNVEHYARIVKEKSTSRDLIYAANKAVEAAYEGNDAAAIVCHTNGRRQLRQFATTLLTLVLTRGGRYLRTSIVANTKHMALNIATSRTWCHCHHCRR